MSTRRHSNQRFLPRGWREGVGGDQQRPKYLGRHVCRTKLPPNLLILEKGEKTPTPKISALVRKRPVLLRANFVLTKDRKRPYYRHFCGKIHREGSCSKAAGGP